MPKTAKLDTSSLSSSPTPPSPPPTPHPTTASATTLPFECPAGLDVGLLDARMLYYVRKNYNVPFSQWPVSLRLNLHTAQMRKQGLIRRYYDPLRFCLTKEGFITLVWLDKLYERAKVSPPED